MPRMAERLVTGGKATMLTNGFSGTALRGGYGSVGFWPEQGSALS